MPVQAGVERELQAIAGSARVGRVRVEKWPGVGMMMTQRGDFEFKVVA